MTQKLHDSGERRKFASGAVRDRGDLKPRPDLISPHAQMREGMIMTLGGVKYKLRNWELGLPISECLASAQRHIEQYKRGDTDEDHIAQARWNLGVILHFEEEIKAGRMDPAIDDMPHYATHGLRTDSYRSKSSDTIPPDRRIVHVPQGVDEIPTYYIAGPMRGYRFFNFPAFDEARDRGITLGYHIISPADLDRTNGIDPLTWSAEMLLWYDVHGWKDLHPEHQHSPDSLRKIITRDTEAIIALEPTRGDGLAFLQYWEKSTGACAERSLAKWLGLERVEARDFKTLIKEV